MIIVQRNLEVVEPDETPRESPFAAQRVPAQQVGLWLIGGDGSEWDLIDGPVKLGPGAKGFHAPGPEHRWRESPALDGATWEGMRTPAGEPVLPVRITTRESLEWRDVQSAFAAATDPSVECLLRLTTPDAVTRTLRLRFEDGFDVEYDIDPMLLRHMVYPLDFKSPDPWWRGSAVQTLFEAVDPLPLFPGPPFYVNPSDALATAKVTNPGHVDAFARYVITGPYSSVTVGVADSTVTLEGAVPAGSSRIIDMDPRRRAIEDETGADKWLEATDANFAAIPAGADVDLNLNALGVGAGFSISLEFTPGYRQAW